MAEDRILTLHPEGKKGVNITRDKYEQVKAVILDALTDTPGMTLDQLFDRSEEVLTGHFDGKIGWYVMSVKLDLEARGVIERVPKASPQRLRLAATVDK